MSLMGKVIRAVNRLFNDRGEQILAEEKDPQLFKAAGEFKAAIDKFEGRVKNENT